MLQSANREQLLADIERELRGLEMLCGRLEAALMRRDWAGLQASLTDSRRTTHALQNALDEAKDARDQQFDEAIFRRIRYVHAIRENQMVRLRKFHDAVGERLTLISRFKSAMRSMVPRRRASSRLGSLDQLT